MKKIIPLLLLLFLSNFTYSQAPQGFNYQAIVRDANGNIRSNQGVQFTFEIRNATGDAVYTEAHTVVTNKYGLADGIIIGNGSTADNFLNINWGAGTYFVNVKVDGIDMGTTQLLSVPYALYALSAGSGAGGEDGVGIRETISNNDGTFTLRYTDGTSFTTIDLRGTAGTDGKSAFEVWLDQGNTGTEADFFLSLTGPKGEIGEKGEKGEKGDDATITGGASSVVTADLDTSRVLVSNVAGKIAVSGISSPELNTLDNIQSNIQAQIDDKQALNNNLTRISAINPSDGSFIVGDGIKFVSEDGNTVRNSLGLGTMSTQNANSVLINGGSITGIADMSIFDGGTGASTSKQARLNLNVDSAGTDNSVNVTLTDVPSNYLSLSGQEITVGTIPIELGGTGGTSAAAARANFELGTMATQDNFKVSITGGDVRGITDIAVADGGTGSSTASGARTNLGLGTMATQNANNVNITGGKIIGAEVSGLSEAIAIADGGTGATTASSARTNLGLAIGSDVQAYDEQLDDISSLDPTLNNFIVGSGTAFVKKNASQTRDALALGSIATQNVNNVKITGGTVTGVTDITLADGGTGASTATDARKNLGIEIGTNVQAYDPELEAIAGLTSAADKGIQFTGDGTAATYVLTTAGKNLLDDANASVQRTTLGLGDIATQSKDNVTITGGSITGVTDIAVADGGTGSSTAEGARTNLGLVIGTNVQAYDLGLQSLSDLTTATDKMLYTTDVDKYSTTDLTGAARNLLDDTDAAAMRTTIGVNLSNLGITSTADELNILDGVTATNDELNILDGVTATTAEINILDGVTATTAEVNILDGVTATTAEINIIDGVTATTAELNILDGVTATTAELNILDGVTATKDELNILDGVTATKDEINILDGVTATTAEINILDGVTATTAEVNKLSGLTTSTTELNLIDGMTADAAELNLLDGVTSTTDELNFTDGVTSNIQTQLDNKQATLTGAATTVLTSDLTVSRALVSNGSGKIGVSDVTAQELGALDGITSNSTELNILDGATLTTTELNLLDGGTAVGSSTTLTGTDGVVVNDGGSMKTVPMSDVSTYVNDNIALNNLSDVQIINSNANEDNAQSIYLGNTPSASAGAAVANVGISAASLNSVTTGDYNIGIGWRALKQNTTGGQNIAIGAMALRDNVSNSGNVAIGYQSMQDANGADSNTAVGNNALRGTLDTDITGDYNSGFGVGTMKFITSGEKNTAVGGYALNKNTGGNSNTAVGYLSSNNIVTGGNYNVSVGSQSLKQNETGNENVAIGNSALFTNKSNYNTALGFNSLYNTNAANNVGLGYKAGNEITSGTDNVVVGYDASVGTATGNNQIVIGSSVTGKGANTVTIGNGDITAWYPTDNNEVDLGSDAVEFKDIYIDGVAYVDGIDLNGASVTSTATEINVVDGSTNASSVSLSSTDGVIVNDNGTMKQALVSDITTFVNSNTSINNLSDIVVEDNSIYIGNDPSSTTSSAEKNIGLGTTAIDAITTGDNNTAVGYDALTSNTEGSANTALGYQAGDVITTGSNNTLLGYGSDASANTATNQIVIGRGATGQGDNYAVIGNADVTRVYAAQDAGATLYAGGLNIGGTAVSSTAAELNILDGVTATATELNLIDGVTATTDEINYVDGVTSAIQTQIDTKQATVTGAATTIASSDLTASRALTSNGSGKVAVSDITSTELGYLDGVTSAIQTQIDTKQATVTGAATTIASSDLTASRALTSNGSGKVAVSDITSTELGYLDGVTSAIQTQIDAKQASITNGSITNAQLAGSIANAKLANSSVSYGGIELALGATDATPAFDLADATNLPIDNVSGITANATNFSNSLLIGQSSTGTLSSADYNVGVGYGVFSSLTSGTGNMANGYNALNSLTTGTGNVAIGRQVLSKLTTGSKNVGIGRQAGIQIVGGSVGGTSLVSGNNNTYIGSETVPSANDVTNETVIGYGATGLGANTVTIGNSSVTVVGVSADNTTDLGSSSKEFKDLYIDGTAYLDATRTGDLIVENAGFATLTGNAAIDGSLDLNGGLNIGGTAVTSTAAELNLVDGSSAGTIVNSKGVIYGSSGEVNATTLQIAGTSITSTAAELNILDGVTSTAAELNILDGVTATATELNLIDGVTATTVEINYLDGVTSNIQTQLDAKGTASNVTGLSDALVESNSLYIGNDPSSTTSTAEKNVAVGTTALDAITTGDNNTAVGYDALSSNTTGSYNSASGNRALYFNTTGNSNTASGYYALIFNTTGSNNTASGRQALYSNSTGSSNSASGNYALYSNTTGNSNTASGYFALASNSTGLNNTALGYQAGNVITTGSNNVIIGYDADPSANDASNQIVIGKDATGQGDNYAVIGNANVTRVYAAQDEGATLYAAGMESSAGSISIASTLADGQTLKLGKNGAVEMIISPHGTAANETFSLTNTGGTDNSAIALTSTAGGITAKVADEMDLTLGNAGGDAYFKVAASGTAGNEDVRIVNTNGTDEAAIAITSSAGGVDVDAAAAKDVNIAGGQVALVSKDDAASAISLTANVGTSETIVITNTQGTGSSAVDINASAGGVDVDAGSGISIDAGAASNLTTSAGALTIDGDGGVNIVGNSSEIDVTTTGTLDMNAAAITVDAGSGVSIDAAAASNLTTSSGALTLDGAGGVNVGTSSSGVAVSIGHTTSEVTVNDNLTVTGNVSGSGTISGFDANLNNQTGTTYTLVAGDNGKVVTLNNGSAITVTIDTGLGNGFNCLLVQKGSGQVTISAGTGVTVVNRSSETKTAGQYATVSVINIGSEQYILSGDTGS